MYVKLKNKEINDCISKSINCKINVARMTIDEERNPLDKHINELPKMCVNTVLDTRNWTKHASPSRESLENRGTDISRSTNLPREICETF